jgi:hypothetical protein
MFWVKIVAIWQSLFKNILAPNIWSFFSIFGPIQKLPTKCIVANYGLGKNCNNLAVILAPFFSIAQMFSLSVKIENRTFKNPPLENTHRKDKT